VWPPYTGHSNKNLISFHTKNIPCSDQNQTGGQVHACWTESEQNPKQALTVWMQLPTCLKKTTEHENGLSQLSNAPKNLFIAFLECKANEELAYVLLHSFFCYTSQVLIWKSNMWQQVTPHSSTELISSQSQIQQTWTIEPRLKKGVLNTIAPTNVKGQAHLSWAYTLIKAPPAFQPITKRYCRTKTGRVKWAAYWGIPAQQHKNSSNQSKYLHHQQSQSSACSVLPVLIRNSGFL
jgi:hypothetical protein